MYNPEVVLQIRSVKSFNCKYKMSKKYLPTIRLMAFLESTILYNPGSTLFMTHVSLFHIISKSFYPMARTSVARVFLMLI